MSILIFIVVLVVLIVAHEFGHFIIAKKSGIRVDEFGVGFPPKLWGKKVGETEYTLNAIPFGGFVKIFGENPGEAGVDVDPRSFSNKPRGIQAAVVAGGIIFNILFAWLLISLGFMVGMPMSQDSAPFGATVRNSAVMITDVRIETPAAIAGLEPGDEITGSRAGETALAPTRAEEIGPFIAPRAGEELVIVYERNGVPGEAVVVPTEGIVPERAAIGIAMDDIGTVRLWPHQALWQGGTMTAELTVATTNGIATFFKDLFLRDEQALTQVMGPVGLVGVVGDAASVGFAYVLLLAALISINLAVINLIPFPALDGGRLLFIAIEAVRGKAINPKVTNTVNAVGFVLLIFLMVLVTYHDIAKLVVGQ